MVIGVGEIVMIDTLENQVMGRDLAEKPIDITFPEKVMTGVAGDFSRLYSEHMEPCPQFFFMAFLTCLGSILTGHLTLDSSLNPQPRLYTLLLGESADDRKSTAIKEVVAFFKDTGSELATCWGVGSAEGLQSMFEQSDRLILLLDEFKYFVSKARIDGSVLLPATTTLFESNIFESHTKTKNISLDNAHLSILAASTIETYQQTWSSIFTDIGFGNRLWIVPGSAKRRFSIPQTIPNRDIARLKNHLGDILAIANDQTRLPIEADAYRIFHEWYMSRDNSIHQKRLDTYGHRLMILLTINDGKATIDSDVVNKVLSLVNWQLAVRRIYDPIDAENSIAKMEERIRRALLQGDKTPRELKQTVHANRGGLWCFNAALDNLKNEKEVFWNNEAAVWCRENADV
jgi:hypothetical protein